MGVTMIDPAYAGSRLLAGVSHGIGLPLDQVNFLLGQTMALILGYIFRVYMNPRVTSPRLRHTFEAVVGTSMIFFLFGYQAMFVLAQSMTCYVLVLLLPARVMPVAVTTAAMLQLSVCHLWRQIYHYRSLTAFDISIPFMINTQRVTSLVWGLYDGQVKDTSQLSANQRRLAIRSTPSLLELMSYTCNFHSVILGPSCFYNDYISFIEGTNLNPQHTSQGSTNNNKSPDVPPCPSPNGRVARRVAMFIIYSLIVLLVYPLFPFSYISEPEFVDSGFVRISVYLLIITATFKCKYFAAWKLSEAVCNMAGFGFYYEDGTARWDLADTANPWKVEFATSLKMLVDNWNVTTGYWLRYVVHERVTSMRNVTVFFMSSLWHGFYPGYYLTAANAAIFSTAARLVRVNFRSKLVTSRGRQVTYDVITCLVTRLTIAYMCFPFIHLEFYHPLQVYRKLYFSYHILVILVIIVLTLRPQSTRTKSKTNDHSQLERKVN